MNVNNVMTYTTSKKVDAPKQTNKSEEFKKVLDNNGLNSKNFSNENIQKKNNKDENLGKTNKGSLDKVNNENQSDDVKNNDVEKPKDNNEVKAKIVNIIEKSIGLLKQNTEKLSKEAVGEESGDQMAQMQQLLQLFNNLLQSLEETPATLKGGDELNPITLESLVGAEQLIPDAKNIFKNSLSEIGALQEKSKGLVGAKQLIPDAKSILKNGLSEIGALQENPKGNETLVAIPQEIELNLIKPKGLNDIEQLIGMKQLTPDAKVMLKSNLSEIVGLLEKSDKVVPSQIIEVLQKLTTVVEDLKIDLSLLKVPALPIIKGNSDDKLIKDNLLKKVMELSTKTISEILPKSQMQSSNDSENGSKSSGNSSSEESFLSNLISEDKDEMKISKAVNFMNQFEVIKTVDTVKVQAVNLVIDKSNFTVDVIKNIKFMEINNIKDLTVKMNPKELGEITIKLTMESGIMKASVSAQNKDTYNLLNQNIQDISDKLKNMDIKIQSLDINIYEDSTFFNKNSNEKNNNGSKNNNRNTSLEDEEDISISNNYSIEENQVNKFV
ncbi:flagellar hook-length control protein FliK [Clostridium tagluense]|uniref:flagellar hook-length control protein FliK n=1 Tax=Clostridium tagluense TaxID=360422 RepID=UPI001C0A95B7|nr:flagellar hook-length control protein FliK [Clostridium tagluense]MBU3126643.1 flagellar hook-length control protein FliK [Clostridium tagluense]MCB2310011.1 flagellar hook-length control protein FliK [Clostridium tagluense]MCB2314459.1 flagellar hook-length control protein FliK [Clostridium tagluense]MCB2319307.1 flagellar hook-length control protein FliK [Clostridium tagluense]MCB2324605.1 flagellar hook-length control protein FliK [Clostridium tagluense]